MMNSVSRLSGQSSVRTHTFAHSSRPFSQRARAHHASTSSTSWIHCIQIIWHRSWSMQTSRGCPQKPKETRQTQSPWLTSGPTSWSRCLSCRVSFCLFLGLTCLFLVHREIGQDDAAVEKWFQAYQCAQEEKGGPETWLLCWVQGEQQEASASIGATADQYRFLAAPTHGH